MVTQMIEYIRSIIVVHSAFYKIHLLINNTIQMIKTEYRSDVPYMQEMGMITNTFYSYEPGEEFLFYLL